MTVQVTHSKLNLAQQPAERCLAVLQTESLSGMRPGDAIMVTRGVLWITQQGDAEDYLIEKGQKFVAVQHGPVVLQAIKGTACYFSRKVSATPAKTTCR